MLSSSKNCASGRTDSAIPQRIASRRLRSGVPFSGSPSIPKMPAMITSSVIACIRGASRIGSPTGQASISLSATSAIIAA